MEHVEDGEIEEAAAKSSTSNGNVQTQISFQNKDRGGKHSFEY